MTSAQNTFLALLLMAACPSVPLVYGQGLAQGDAAAQAPGPATAPPANDKPDAPTPQRATPQLAPQLASQLVQAQEALDRKDYPAAIVLLQKLVSQRPDDALLHFQLGYAYSEQKQLDQAAAEYRRAIGLNDRLVEAYLNLGLVLRESDPASAAAAFRRAAELMPGDSRPHYLAGEALEHSGKLADAVTEYQTAVTIAPKDAPIRLALGSALLRAERPTEAESQFREAIALGGGAQATLGLAETLVRLDNKKEAADSFATYLKAAPDDRQARFELAATLQRLDRFDEALAELDRIEQGAAPTPMTLKLRAGIYMQEMEWAEAANTLAKAVLTSPEDAQMYAWLGNARLNQRDFAGAETALRRSLTLDPAPTEPLRDLENVYYFSHQCQPALATLDLLAQRATPLALDWFFRATCYDKLLQVKQAVAAYQKFLELDAGAHSDQDIEARGRVNLLAREAGNKR